MCALPVADSSCCPAYLSFNIQENSPSVVNVTTAVGVGPFNPFNIQVRRCTLPDLTPVALHMHPCCISNKLMPAVPGLLVSTLRISQWHHAHLPLCLHCLLQAMPRGVGSGFVWDRKGHVITNAHVVSQGAEVQLTLSDSSVVKAKVRGWMFAVCLCM